MVSAHEVKALAFRASAAQARERAAATPLPMVREREERAAVRWDALARFEDDYIQAARDRSHALAPA